MNIRMPNATDAARILREALAEKGVSLKHTQVLELIARLQGYRNAHVMRKAAKFEGPVALQALGTSEFELPARSPYARIVADRFAVTLKREALGLRVLVSAEGGAQVLPLADTLYPTDGTVAPFAPALAALTASLGGLKSQFSSVESEDPWCECANCGTRTRESDLKEIRDFGERVMPGEECPAGECPECGALAHIAESQSETADEESLEDAEDSAGVSSGEVSSRARCPGCGVPTIPDREGLTDEEMMCDRCEAKASSHWDLVPANPAWVEVSGRDHETGSIDRRAVRFVNPAFGSLATLDCSDDSVASQTAIEYEGLEGEVEEASFWDLLVAPLDELGSFHLQDGRILCFKH